MKQHDSSSLDISAAVPWEGSADVRAFGEVYANFLAARVVPGYAQWRRDAVLPREVLTEAAELGFLGVYGPEEHGGGGVDDPGFGLLMTFEAARQGCLGFALVVGLHAAACVPYLSRCGGESAAELLSRLTTGRALAGPASGAALEVVESDTGWRCRGTAGTVVGAAADVVLLQAHKGRDVVTVAVETSSSTFRLTPAPDALGLREAGVASPVVDVDLGTDPVVAGAASQLTGLVDLVWAAAHLGAAHAALQWTGDYVRQRKVFGRPLIEMENTQNVLQSLARQYRAATAAVRESVRVDATAVNWLRDCAAVRSAAARSHWETVDSGLQLHGGYGFMLEYPIAQAYADAGMTRVITGRDGRA